MNGLPPLLSGVPQLDIEAGRLTNDAATSESAPITMHDPCYLARVNGVVDAPRTVIGAAQDENFREMPRCGKKTSCCGAGGGPMWFEEKPGERVPTCARRKRSRPAARFALNMMSDGMAGTSGGENVKVLDIAEPLLSRQENSLEKAASSLS